MRTQSLLSLSFCAVALLVLYGCAEFRTPAAGGGRPRHCGSSVRDGRTPRLRTSTGRPLRPTAGICGRAGPATGKPMPAALWAFPVLTCHTKPAGPENCTTCHGSTNAAPPKDLSNNTSNDRTRQSGAHQVHLVGPRESRERHNHVQRLPPCSCDRVRPRARGFSGSRGGCHQKPSGEGCRRAALHRRRHTTRRPKSAPTCSATVVAIAEDRDERTPSCSTENATEMARTNFAPTWNAGAPQAACGTCHASTPRTGSRSCHGPQLFRNQRLRRVPCRRR